MSSRTSSKAAIYSIPEGSCHTILTGDRPTGPLHLGHYYGSLRRRVECQSRFAQYVLVADVQALTDHADNPEMVRTNIIEVVTDYLAVGIDPSKSTIFLQSGVPETTELTLYFLNLVNVGRLMRNPTIKAEIKQKGFGDEIPAGFLCYPVNQAADISQFQATLVPVGADQIPMIEITNDITRAFNRIYKTDYFVPCQALVPSAGLLPGIDGDPKMGKSLDNAIYLGDDADTVSKKVKAMFTDPNHLRVEDPGRVEGNPVFAYLDAFDDDRDTLQELKCQYEKGGLGDGMVKKRLSEILNAFLDPIRERRRRFEKDPGEIIRILRNGTQRARGKAASTISHVRKCLGMSMF